MTALLTIFFETLKEESANWIFAASVPFLMYLMSKRRKTGWLQRLLLRKALKRRKSDIGAAQVIIIILVIIGAAGLISAIIKGMAASGLLFLALIFALIALVVFIAKES